MGTEGCFILVEWLNVTVQHTEDEHDGSENREGKELGGMVHKWVVGVVLRVHMHAKCHTRYHIHGEATETPAGEIVMS